jgi:hypothetical protein
MPFLGLICQGFGGMGRSWGGADYEDSNDGSLNGY